MSVDKKKKTFYHGRTSTVFHKLRTINQLFIVNVADYHLRKLLKICIPNPNILTAVNVLLNSLLTGTNSGVYTCLLQYHLHSAMAFSLIHFI